MTDVVSVPGWLQGLLQEVIAFQNPVPQKDSNLYILSPLEKSDPRFVVVVMENTSDIPPQVNQEFNRLVDAKKLEPLMRECTIRNTLIGMAHVMGPIEVSPPTGHNKLKAVQVQKEKKSLTW